MRDLPNITARREHDQVLELDFTLATDCPWLEGHFPGQPILPGVVQIGWAAHFAGLMLARGAGARHLQRVKFKRPVLPGAHLTLRLFARGTRVGFEYLMRADGHVLSVSSGTLDFEEAA